LNVWRDIGSKSRLRIWDVGVERGGRCHLPYLAIS
jgi:hypothetical protein